MQWYSLNTIWMIALTIELTSQSEILIIRHGRSRSRHSSEKEHIRWGLKALDNQTIAESRDGLIESKEHQQQQHQQADVNVVSFYEHNGTLSPTNEFNGTIGSYEINYTYGPRGSSGSSEESSSHSSKRRHFDWQYESQVLREQLHTTTEMSPKHSHSKNPSVSIRSSSSSNNVNQGKQRRNGKRKEFMTNIKSTVNKGIQYLKAHENLDEIEIEINDFNTRHSSNRDDIKHTDGSTIISQADIVQTTKTNKIRSKSIDNVKADQKTSVESSVHVKQQHKYHLPKQIKINGGNKDFSAVTITSSELDVKGGKNITIQQKFKKSSVNEKQITQRHAASKHIKIHQAHNEIDMNINSNLADIFYVPKENPQQHNKPYAEDELMLSDEPAGNKMDIKESLMEKSNQHNQTENDANQKHEIKKANSTVASTSRQNGILDTTKLNATHANGFNNKNTTMHTDKANKTGIKDFNSSPTSMAHEMPTNERHEGNIQHFVNDDIINDEQQNEEFINSIAIQNDDVSNENTIDFDGEFDDSTSLNTIFHVEDLDLSDFDETSRNNRKNLMRGRDVVTRFLQIVESQHMLGTNCTAGTALNLGEGVVDRYAQDRFRVEAEVAVNRANMLTR